MADEKFQTVNGVNLESEDFLKALKYIGKMLHYVQDACEPHHSSNEVALPFIDTPHSEFESYAFNNYANFSQSYYWDSSEYNQCIIYTEDDIGMIVHRAAIKSHAYIDNVNDLNNRGAWENIGGICTRYSISMSAISMRIAFTNMGEIVAL